MKKVSILVPCHNAERTIEQCLMSAINQTMCRDDCEIIVIDDGSDDASASVIERIASDYPDTIVFKKTPDNGQAATMNLALSLASGVYITELDSDDWYEPNAIEVMFRAMEENCADALQCSYIGEMNDGSSTECKVANESLCRFYSIPPREFDIVYAPIIFGRVVSVWAGMYRRRFLQENGIYWRSGVNFEDTSISFKIRAYANNFILLHDALYHHRVNYAGSGTATINDSRAIFHQFDEVFRVADDLHMHIDSYLSVWMFYTFEWAFGRLKTDEDRNEFLNTASDYFKRHRPLPMFFNTHEDAQIFDAICNRDAPLG